MIIIIITIIIIILFIIVFEFLYYYYFYFAGLGFSLNSGRIINCTSIGSGFCVYGGSSSSSLAAENTGLISNCNSSGLGFAILDGLSIGTNLGQILNCYVDEEGFCGSGGDNGGIIIECTAQYTSFCNQNAAGISGPILKCTLLGDVFIVGTPPFGGRVVLGIDNTGVVNY